MCCNLATRGCDLAGLKINNLVAGLNAPFHSKLSSPKMASIIAKIISSVFGASRHTKIAILGLDGAGGLDLVKRVCDTAIEQHTDKTRATAYTGTNHTLKFDFVVLEVGGGAKAEYHWWTAQQFCDADAFIWVVDSADTDRLMESQLEMKICRQGRRLMHGLVQPAVRAEAPWLVLIDFKRNSLVGLSYFFLGYFAPNFKRYPELADSTGSP